VLRSSVPNNVTLEFALPEFATGLWEIGQPAIVSMPEAAVHKDGDPPAPKDDVGFSREFPGMEPKTVSHRVQKPADGQFWGCIAAPDTGHEGTAFLPAHDVGARTGLASARYRW